MVGKVEKRFGCQKRKYHEIPEKERQAVKQGYPDKEEQKKTV